MKEIIILNTDCNTLTLIVIKPAIQKLTTKHFDFNAYCGMCDKFLTSSCKYYKDKRMHASIRHSTFGCTVFNQR